MGKILGNSMNFKVFWATFVDASNTPWGLSQEECLMDEWIVLVI